MAEKKKTKAPVLKMAPVLKLAQPSSSTETVETLLRLLSEARAGQVVGLAYVALHSGARYSGDVVGRARAFPLYTLGLCKALEDQLAKLRG